MAGETARVGGSQSKTSSSACLQLSTAQQGDGRHSPQEAERSRTPSPPRSLAHWVLLFAAGPLSLTSIILSPIHLIIHIHGKFLKKSVAELEVEKGNPGSVRMSCDVGKSPDPCHPAYLRTEGRAGKVLCARKRESRPFPPLGDEALDTPLEGRTRIKDKGMGRGWEGGGWQGWRGLL